jgi:hypothetical protein
MRKLILAAIVATFSLSCDKEKFDIITECGDGSPIESWIIEMNAKCTDDDPICHLSILRGLYQGKSVFFETFHGALCDPVFHVALMDCNGDTIKEYGLGDQQKLINEVDSVKILFTCPDN